MSTHMKMLPYGLEVADIVYLDWIVSGADVLSVTIDMHAPCGQQLFALFLFIVDKSSDM